MDSREKEKVTSCRCHFCGSAACNVNVFSKGDMVTKVLPDPEWPNSEAHCSRLANEGKAALEYHYHADRLNYPLKRTGKRGENAWEQISWDQALDEISARLNALRAEFGPETLAAITGTHHYSDNTWPKSRFLNLFGSPNNLGNEQICHGPMTKAYETTLGWAGQLYMVAGVTKCLVLNSNQRESAPPMFSNIEQCKWAGGKIISINPRFGDVGRLADYYVPLRPGTDGALYLAWLHVIIEEELYDKEFVEKWCVGFDDLREAVKEWTPEKAAEVCWVPADTIAETARVYATNKPSRIIAMQAYDGQAPNGFRTLRAVAMLEAITGNIDDACYVLGPYTGENLFIDDFQMECTDRIPEDQWKKQVGGERFSVLGYPGWKLIGEQQKKRFGTQMYSYWSNQAHGPLVWRQILSGEPYPIKALIISGAAPLTKYSNPKIIYEAYKKLDLIVVLDFFHNPNTMMADYVLPMSDWMERDILETNTGHLSGFLASGMRAVNPMFERRSDYEFWRELGMRCGQQDDWPWKTLRDVYDYRLSPQNLTFEEFALRKKSDAIPLVYHMYEQTNPKTGKPYGFGTPSGKVELKSAILDELGFDPVTHYEEPNFSPYSTPEYAEKYPYILITGGRVQPYYHSEHRQIPSLRAQHPDPIVEINPETAQALNPPVADGDWV